MSDFPWIQIRLFVRVMGYFCNSLCTNAAEYALQIFRQELPTIYEATELPKLHFFFHQNKNNTYSFVTVMHEIFCPLKSWLFVTLVQKWTYVLMFAFSWIQICLLVWVKVTGYFSNSIFYLLKWQIASYRQSFSSSFLSKYSYTKATSKIQATMFRDVTVRNLFQVWRTQVIFKTYKFFPLHSNLLS